VKELNGSELAGFIKERQVKAVRGLRQQHGVAPKLAIVVTVDDPVIEIYIRLKQNYGKDVLVDVDVHRTSMDDVEATINKLNNDSAVHGVIVQLPLADPERTDVVVNLVAATKDVDALGKDAQFDPATPTAILWLLAGYNVILQNRKVTILGKGKLVGAPLEKMLVNSGVNARALDASDNTLGEVAVSDVIVTATGSPGSLTSQMIPKNAVVVDAGVAMEKGSPVGDLAADVYERDDLKVTPRRGGVGPLTVCALFENVLIAARRSIGLR